MDDNLPVKQKKFKGPGRPKANITYEQVYELASVGASIPEIAKALGVNEGTIDERFADAAGKGRAEMCLALRKKQIELALKGNITMLIFLGKAYLNQYDTIKTEATVTQTTKYESPEDLKRKLNELVMARLNHYHGKVA